MSTSPPPPQRNGASGKVRVIAVVLALAGVGVWWFLSRGNTTGANAGTTSGVAASQVGDCLHNQGTDDDPDMRIVGCTASDADFKVAEKYYVDHACETSGASRYQQTRKGKVRYTLCLTEVTH
jgi:hypothetical protein